MNVENSISYDFNKTCRTCLSQKGKLISIFSKMKSNQKSYSEMIMSVSSFEITETDILPHFICLRCVRWTIISYSFKNKVNDSEAILRKYTSDRCTELQLDSQLTESDNTCQISKVCFSKVNVKDKFKYFKYTKIDKLEKILRKSDHPEDLNMKETKKPRITENIHISVKSDSDNNNRNAQKDDLILKLKDNFQNILQKYHCQKLNTNEDYVDCDHSGDKIIYDSEIGAIVEEIAMEEKNKIICNICNKLVAASDIKQHKAMHLQQPINTSSKVNKADKVLVNCNKCDHVFPCKSKLKKHIAARHAIKKDSDVTYVCNKCDEVFNTHRKFIIHQKIHNGSQHTCEICGVHCESKSKLTLHIISHTGQKPYLCATCGKCYISNSKLRAHEMKHSNEDQFPCGYCEKKFQSAAFLHTHLRTHGEFKPFVCSVSDCRQAFEKPGELHTHNKIHKNFNPFQCQICQKTWASVAKLNAHMNMHAHPKEYKCKICNCKFKFKGNFIIHNKSHDVSVLSDNLPEYNKDTDSVKSASDHINRNIQIDGFISNDTFENVFQKYHSQELNTTEGYADCDNSRDEIVYESEIGTIVEEIATEERNLQRTVNTSSIVNNVNESLVNCSKCDHVFTCQSMLKKHMAARHTIKKDSNVTYVCNKCDEVFNTHRKFYIHQKIHNGSQHTCEICGVHCESKSKLALHIISHTGQKPYMCATCGKCYISNSKLRAHEVKHSNEDQFECSYCEKKYHSASLLHTHLRNHGELRPFVCFVTDCGQAFEKPGELNVHTKIHENIKPFECQICQKTWASVAKLNAHMNIHAHPKDYNCKICDRKFKLKRNLTLHYKTHDVSVLCDNLPVYNKYADSVRTE